jgi:hypothetical protein
MKKISVKRILIAIVLLLYLMAGMKLAFGGSYTPMGEYEPSPGETSYGVTFNANFDKIDQLQQGWVYTNWTYTYVNGTTYNITGNKTAYLTAGMPVQAMLGITPVSGTISSVTWSNPNTVVVLTASVLTSALTTVYHAIPIHITIQPTVAVASTDTTPSYLINKITAGTNIAITHNNIGGNENISIAASGGVTGGASLGGGSPLYSALSGSTLQFNSISGSAAQTDANLCIGLTKIGLSQVGNLIYIIPYNGTYNLSYCGVDLEGNSCGCYPGSGGG